LRFSLPSSLTTSSIDGVIGHEASLIRWVAPFECVKLNLHHASQLLLNAGLLSGALSAGDKKYDSYQAFLQLGCALISLRFLFLIDTNFPLSLNLNFFVRSVSAQAD
jgi:hypothetical protein